MVVAPLLSVVWAEAEQEVWYNATGEVAMVTELEEEKEPFVPAWVQREAQRDAALRGRFWYADGRRSYGRVQRYYSSWYSPGYVWGGYRRYHRPCHYGAGGIWGRGSYGIRARYHGNGWSVRIGR